LRCIVGVDLCQRLSLRADEPAAFRQPSLLNIVSIIMIRASRGAPSFGKKQAILAEQIFGPPIKRFLCEVLSLRYTAYPSR
jgi:hypothetical protein